MERHLARTAPSCAAHRVSDAEGSHLRERRFRHAVSVWRRDPRAHGLPARPARDVAIRPHCHIDLVVPGSTFAVPVQGNGSVGDLSATTRRFPTFYPPHSPSPPRQVDDSEREFDDEARSIEYVQVREVSQRTRRWRGEPS